MKNNPLEKLICGSVSKSDKNFEDEAVLVLKGLSKLVVSYYEFSLEYKRNLDNSQASYFLPVALRSLMESASIALLARIDPLRVLLSSKSQNSTNYNKALPQASALKWKGDVMSEFEKQSGTPNDNTPKDIWAPNLSSSKLPRNLLSPQMCEAFWEPAAKNLANQENTSACSWISDLQSKTPADLIKKIIGDGNQIYSELSKGIHPEFAVKRESEYDAPTLLIYLERTMKWTASLGLLSHATTSFSNRIELIDAISAIKAVEESTK